MNFLGHLHLADVSGSSLLGNLLGDFVRGNPDGRFPDDVVTGIRLHRFIDSYTDSHPGIIAIKPLFGEYRRFALIALDLFWDHCLINHWDKFHTQPFQQFCNHARKTTHPKYVSVALPERYQAVISSMWEGQWLASYQQMDNVGYALERMSNRTPRMGPLAQCADVLNQHYTEFNQVFLDFYPEVIEAVNRQKIK